jgi:hypothetical protein
VRIAAHEYSVEITMALTPGRKLGAEYRFGTETEFDPVANWIDRTKDIPTALEEAIKRKVSKCYDPPIWLVIYFNINNYGTPLPSTPQDETETAIASLKPRHARSFDGIFVLWNGKLY